MAYQKYDMEKILEDVKTVITTYLNTKLSDITTEKGDGLSVPSIASTSLYLQDLDQTTVNCDPFILYGISDIRVDGSGPMSLKTYDIEIVLVKSSTYLETGEFAKIMYRYQRAIEEIFEEHWTDGENASKIIVTSLVPRAIPLMNSTHQHRACGLVLSVTCG